MPSRIDIDTLWQLERVASVAVAPDGSAAVCAVTSYSMQENKGATSLWLLPTASCAPRRLTRCGEKDGRPAWSPRGDRIAFLAKREQEGRKDTESQLYVIDAAGGEAERKSNFLPGIEDFRWMPDGRRIVFVSWVWPGLEGSRAQDKQYKAFSERKESAYVTAEAQYRHFDRGLPMGRVPHLLLLDLASGRITDLFEGTGYELPRVEPGAAHFDVSPDGRRIAFVHDPAPRKVAVHPTAIAEIDLATRRVTALTNGRVVELRGAALQPRRRTARLRRGARGPAPHHAGTACLPAARQAASHRRRRLADRRRGAAAVHAGRLGGALRGAGERALPPLALRCP